MFTLALSEGTREQVQWLAAQGCPMGVSGGAGAEWGSGLPLK